MRAFVLVVFIYLETFYISKLYFYYNGCMQVRNRYLVDHSSACICYLNNLRSGTAYTVKYAESQGLQIINLAE